MIKFFRHIRQNLIMENKTGSPAEASAKAGKYLKYAIGEIVLVVIGILIALQINNWNQDRIEHKETKALLSNLKLDVVEDIKNLKGLKNSLKDRKEWADLILNSIDEQKVSDSTMFISAMTRVGWIMEISLTLPTYKEIVSSGKLSHIKSDNLKKALANYQSQFEEHHLIVSSYHPGLKETERLAIGHLNGMPDASSSNNPNMPLFQGVSFNLNSIAEDAEFYKRVKQISYQTSVTIDYISVQLVTKAEGLKNLIVDELKSY
ncbi:hypothetical protein NA63_2865 [Flavobacteriaceae bacterium MAR_2010_105]|nr:hypothetical protein NA63_2865 [Flavobacteriaceae bacterium MAR_2010_105]